MLPARAKAAKSLKNAVDVKHLTDSTIPALNTAASANFVSDFPDCQRAALICDHQGRENKTTPPRCYFAATGLRPALLSCHA